MIPKFLRRKNTESGQGFVEYIMLIGLVAVGLTLALIAFQGQISTALSTVGIGV
jgi:Flp pilus assembly pilin Flp